MFKRSKRRWLALSEWSQRKREVELLFFHQFMTLQVDFKKSYGSSQAQSLFLRSVVLVPLVRTLRARVEDCAAFVGRAQLLGVVACLRVATLLARVVDDGVGLDLALVVFLHIGAEAGAER